MASTGTRLRKTFKYPSDSKSSDGTRDEMDEEEQETLISDLAAKNTQQNAIYTLIFTILPLLLITPFLFVFSASPVLSMLAITSLLITAGRMRFFGPHTPPARARNGAEQDRFLRWCQLSEVEQNLVDAVPQDGPLKMALPWLNGVMCGVLFLAAGGFYYSDGNGRSPSGPAAMWIFCLLPALAWMMREIAVRTMADVDQGVGDLQRLRYRYKGA